jgi:hypothetical protein
MFDTITILACTPLESIALSLLYLQTFQKKIMGLSGGVKTVELKP